MEWPVERRSSTSASCSAQQKRGRLGRPLRISGAATIPAAAQTQTTTEYYVVQDVKTKKCTIVEKKPTTTTEVTVLGNMFKTRNEAEAGMKTEKVCVSN
jgi:hypothetical protein